MREFKRHTKHLRRVKHWDRERDRWYDKYHIELDRRPMDAYQCERIDTKAWRYTKRYRQARYRYLYGVDDYYKRHKLSSLLEPD